MKTKYLFIVIALTSIFFKACVKDEIFQGPPVISDLVLTPQVPSENQAVQVSVKVTDMNGVKSVTLFYKAGQGNLTEVQMTGNDSNIYTGQIPGQAADVTVTYYIMAENKTGQKAYMPSTAPTTPAAFTVGAPLIVMNEIYSRGTVDAPDWIEIYNASDVAVDISSFKIYDNGGQSGSKPKLPFPAGTIIQPKGFFVIVTDIGGDSGFGLSSGGEEVWLENGNGNVIDNVVFPAMDVTQSYGRNPDGSPNWQLLNTITRGAPNSAAAPAAIIKMNEIFSRGTTENPDWIELYNASDFAANIGGYKIYDNGGQSGSKPKLEIPAGTTIPAKGFYVIVVDDGTTSGFGLSSAGEEVWLENAAGTIIDNVTFPALEENQSYGRYPDGANNWQVLFVVTRGTANDNTLPQPQAVVVMNEIYSRGTVEAPDWIEFYNKSDVQADISGFKIYDNGGFAGTKPKKVIPAGTVIPAKGYFVIATEGTGDPSDFGLSSGGEEVWFENADGTVIDNVTFAAMDVTQSYGRLPDGSDNWQLLAAITPGAANSNVAPVVNKIFLNEIYSRGTPGDEDWIEVHNLSSDPIDLSGYKVYDNGGQSGSKPKKAFPAGTTIPGNGFIFIRTEGSGDASDFGISSNGEWIWLDGPEGNVVDSVLVAAMAVDQSYGRLPDGTGQWQLLATLTPGAPNSNATPNHIWMNEIFSRGVVSDPDWIEIYNSSGAAIDISGYKIYDNGGYAGTKPKKLFPEGTVIPANGFFVIVVDDADPSGFGLSSNGEEVWLENASGVVIDNIVFPALDVTQSYGRKPDGSANLVIFTEITRGTSNNNAGTLP